MVDVYFNGEWVDEVPLHITHDQVLDRFWEELSDEGYDLSGDTKILSVQLEDKGWQVWYE